VQKAKGHLKPVQNRIFLGSGLIKKARVQSKIYILCGLGECIVIRFGSYLAHTVGSLPLPGTLRESLLLSSLQHVMKAIVCEELQRLDSENIALHVVAQFFFSGMRVVEGGKCQQGVVF
jgi:hypothetical protein